MHCLYTPISMTGAPFIAKSSVEEYDLTSKTKVYSLRRITLSALSRAQFAEIISQNRGKYAYSADALSVSQLFDFVKQNDSDFHTNPPSYVVNEDGMPDVMYGDKKYNQVKNKDVSTAITDECNDLKDD